MAHAFDPSTGGSLRSAWTTKQAEFQNRETLRLPKEKTHFHGEIQVKIELRKFRYYEEKLW